MAYIGNIPAEAYTNTVKDSFNGTGSATAFTLSQPTVTNDVRVVVENVVQDPTVAYSVSGTTLTFTSAPPSGTANIYVVHLGAAVMTAIPPSEIADATTFASSVTVQGAFTSLGIDDNANATAITIDSSENVLVGKTSDTYSVAGASIRANPSGVLSGATVTRDGANVVSLNRLTNDGDILTFSKDTTTVGSIGSAASGTNLYMSAASGVGLGIGGDNLYPVNASGASTDGSLDIGDSTARFKDLYLSGGAYLGGTGAANKLDDYEEGTFTPVVAGGTSAGTASYSTQSGSYTKVGNLVTVWIRLNYTSGNGSGSLQVKGFPFTVVTTNIPTFVVYTVGITASSTALPAGFCNLSNGIQLVENQTGGNSGPTLAYDGSGEIIITGTYPTNA